MPYPSADEVINLIWPKDALRRRRPHILWGLIPAGVFTAISFSVLRSSTNHLQFPSLPWQSDPTLIKPIALNNAEKIYFQHGAKYIWGENDCSKFVCDYMKALPVRVTDRMTTAEFYQPGFMQGIGFTEVNHDYRAGDVIVYRYKTPGKRGGHCGVIVKKGPGVYVRHNSASRAGIATDTIGDFLAKAKMRGVAGNLVRVYRPKAAPGLKPMTIAVR